MPSRSRDELDLGRVEVRAPTSADVRRRDAPLVDKHAERHPPRVPGRRRLGRVQVAVRVEPDDRRAGRVSRRDPRTAPTCAQQQPPSTSGRRGSAAATAAVCSSSVSRSTTAASGYGSSIARRLRPSPRRPRPTPAARARARRRKCVPQLWHSYPSPIATAVSVRQSGSARASELTGALSGRELRGQRPIVAPSSGVAPRPSRSRTDADARLQARARRAHPRARPTRRERHRRGAGRRARRDG